MKHCPICKATTIRERGEVPGYVGPKSYQVQCCEICNLNFVEANEDVSSVYAKIYKHREKVSGYTRYLQYVHGVLRNPDPLFWLAQQEDIYWGIREAVLNLPQNGARSETRILDIGCGLGYLTHALNKSGFDCRGVDISAEAVQKAREQFGDHFTHIAIEGLPAVLTEQFDAIVLAELIEHLIDPLETVKTCLKILKPNGRIILTTPNKSAYPENTLWVSDVPPVHLLFFSEDSIGKMARILNCKVDFISFHHYNYTHYLPRSKGRIIAPPVHPGFDADEKPIEMTPQANMLASVAKAFKVYPLLSILRSFAVQMTQPLRCRPILCAVLTKK